MISFDATPEVRVLVAQIAERAARELDADITSTEMDLIAANANDCKLDMKRLLAFDAFNFAHDVLGIARHLNRRTGKLENCFLPRCARDGITTEAPAHE